MKQFFIALLGAALVGLFGARDASAHQPYFEETDLTFDAPYVVRDVNVSVAYYATLDSARDVDYFAFEGKAGQQVFLELTIPQIAGQENFAPLMAVLGAGLPDGNLPARIERPSKTGAQIIAPPATARTFYEPFSGTSYWERQKEFVTLPADGRYLVAVWHPQGMVGRYVFVTGTREVMGGDMAFPFKMRDYWTPVLSLPHAPSLFERVWQFFGR